MQRLSTLQQLQNINNTVKMLEPSPAYSVYRIEDADKVVRVAIPIENVVEFDIAVAGANWNTIEMLVEKYQGFIDTEAQK